MTKYFKTQLIILKVIGFVIVWVTANILVGIFGFLPDIGPSEGPFERALFVWFVLFYGGVYLGLTFPNAWYLSITIALFPIFNIASLFQYAGELSNPNHYNKYAYWIPFNITILSTMVALASGYLGSRINRRFRLQTEERSKYLFYSIIILLVVPTLIFINGAFNMWRSSSTDYGYIGMGDPPYMMSTGTPLHVAAEQGDIEEISRLIEQSENINAKDMAGRTPLHYAVGEQQTAAVELLLSKGADADIKDNVYHVTPLHWATASRNMEIVILLSPKVKDIDARNKEGQTAAEIASADHQDKILQVLIKHGAKLPTTP